METNGEIPTSHWKPTEAQKEILERLFKEGRRDRSRNGINEVTNLLKHHGDVEAKNVFYWFQNADVSKKQKQKMNPMQHYFNRQDIGTNSFSSLCPTQRNGMSFFDFYGMSFFERNGNWFLILYPCACSGSRITAEPIIVVAELSLQVRTISFSLYFIMVWLKIQAGLEYVAYFLIDSLSNLRVLHFIRVTQNH
jgi:hypothetical protein